MRLDRASVAALEEDPCGDSRVRASALLIDLRKPMRAAPPSSVFVEVARGIDTGSELRVFTVTADPVAPRRFVGRLCRPYDHNDLQVSAAKDGSADVRDCDDLPAQLAPGLRQAALDYCAKRAALGRRIDDLAAAASGASVPNAYLMEALEDTVRELAAGTASRKLFVLSDMLQHVALVLATRPGVVRVAFRGLRTAARCTRSSIPRRPACGVGRARAVRAEARIDRRAPHQANPLDVLAALFRRRRRTA